MYLVIKFPGCIFPTVRRYLEKLGCLLWKFEEPHYQVTVTAHARAKHLSKDSNLNPYQAWTTCASYQGEGIAADNFHLTGTCTCPGNLNSISCVKHCTEYTPKSIEALIFLATKVAMEHDLRANALRQQIARLEGNDELYREAVASGGLIQYKDGHFSIRTD